MRALPRSVLAVTLFATFNACVGTPVTGEDRAPIISGTDDDRGLYPFVGAFNCAGSMGSNPSCSGTLIGQHTFLMAAHCLSDGLKSGEKCLVVGESSSPSSITLNEANLGGDESPLFSATRLTAAPGYDRNAGKADHDLAIASLSGVATGISPVPIAHSAPALGERVTMVGYGFLDAPGTSGCPPDCGPGVRRYGQSTVSAVHGTTFETQAPSASNPAGPCYADSGGPAFPASGPPVVLGTISRAAISSDMTCSGPTAWALAASDRHFITYALLNPGGAIEAKYGMLGGSATVKSVLLGDPASDENGTCKGGVIAMFDSGVITYATATAAHEVHGPILVEWQALGAACSFLGLPTTDVTPTSCGGGSYSNFQGGAITWSTAADAHETHGPMRSEWASLGFECGLLGLPTTDERPTSCGGASYYNFEHGAITWRSDVGAHYTSGPIRQAWAKMDYECGCLGLPKADPVVLGGPSLGETVQTFEHGTITMINATGQTSASCGQPNICANALDGIYCGDSHLDGFPGTGDPTSTYTCHGHAVMGTQACASDCFIQPNGHPDTCDACAFAADGVYCGFSTADGFPGSGQPQDLYFCHGHATTQVSFCAAGCSTNSNSPDSCDPCAGPVCGAHCCAAEAWCGSGGRCCTGCGPGCPC